MIEVDALEKRYGALRAVDGVSFRVAAGEVVALLGPNGAGKSTTIRVLLGLLRRDRGEVTLLGGDPWRDAVRLHRRLAYVPGDVHLWPNLTGGEAIDLLGELRGGLDEQRRAELIERFQLDPTKRCSTYSKGNRQKVALISALASDVELLLLDEPTAGLDPLMEAIFQDAIREARASGSTVLLSSHILAQVEVLADRISIIRQGRIVESGTLRQLRHLTRTTFMATTDRSADRIAALAGVHHFEHVDGQVRFEVDGEQVAATVEALAPLGVTSLTAHPPTLEQLLMRHYDDDASSRSAGDDEGSA